MRLYEMTDDKGSYAAVTFDPTTTEALKAYQYDNNIPNQKYCPSFFQYLATLLNLIYFQAKKKMLWF